MLVLYDIINHWLELLILVKYHSFSLSNLDYERQRDKMLCCLCLQDDDNRYLNFVASSTNHKALMKLFINVRVLYRVTYYNNNILHQCGVWGRRHSSYLLSCKVREAVSDVL